VEKQLSLGERGRERGRPALEPSAHFSRAAGRSKGLIPSQDVVNQRRLWSSLSGTWSHLSSARPQFFLFRLLPTVQSLLSLTGNMASFSRPSLDDVDDWAGLSGFSLGVPTDPGASGQGFTKVPSSSNSNDSPALTSSSTSSTGEYNAFTFVGGLVSGGDQNEACGVTLPPCKALNPAWVKSVTLSFAPSWSPTQLRLAAFLSMEPN
jgi:hypothetical protein